MTEASVDQEQTRAERRLVDPTVKYALDFVRSSEDRQAQRAIDAEARADARNRELIAALGVVTTRMGTHADAQKVILVLVGLLVLMVLLIASMRGADVVEVGKATGAIMGGALGGGS